MIVRHSPPRHSPPPTFTTPNVKCDVHHPRHSPPPCKMQHSPPPTFRMYILQPCAEGHTETPLNEQHSTIVGSIYPIQIHILETVHSRILCPKGTQTPPTEQHSTIVGSIYPIYDNHPRRLPPPTFTTPDTVFSNPNSRILEKML